MAMANLDEKAQAVDAIHARVVSAEVEIRRALRACEPALEGHSDRVRSLNEALRLLNNATACLPWRDQNSTK